MFRAEKLEQIYYPKAISQQKKQLMHDTNQIVTKAAFYYYKSVNNIIFNWYAL